MFSFSVLHCCGADGPTVALTLEWDANVESNVVGYVVFYGGVSREYTNSVSVSLPLATIPGLLEGSTYFFAVAARSQSGLRSPLSAELAWTIPRTRVQVCISPASDGTVRIQFESLPGKEHLLQASADMSSWRTLSTIPSTTQPTLIEWVDQITDTEPFPGAAPCQFYRVISR